MNDTMTTKPESRVGLQPKNNTQKLPGGITGKGFRPGQSGNPSGRRPGAISPTAALRRALTRADAEAIARAIIDGAKAGEPACLRLLFDRLDGPLESQTAPVAVAFNQIQEEKANRWEKDFDWGAFGELCKQVRLVPPNDGGGEAPQSASAGAVKG